MRVRCRLCSHFKNGTCSAKTAGGVATNRSPNKPRECDKFEQDPIAFAELADREYEKNKIPRFSPTWRYYASDRELKDAGAENHPKFVRINPVKERQ
jgi:hypothetical protein